MPTITPLGWFHTGIAIIAILAGIYALAVHKLIKPDQRSGLIYLVCTLLAAATSLMIYNQGTGFGPAHALGVLTLLALAGGFIVPQLRFLGGLIPYLQALCFSATLLFHMIPAITDGLRRLPVGDPVVDRIDDPLLRGFYLAFLVLFLLGYGAQVLWLRRQRSA
ncbi:MAG: hypothetical protein ACK44O_07170 [Novosphingobium sp.]|jgi:hypothetical protein|uniref:hypothetical protein n=1 Tax=Novosphingobium sp. TaxID=1874826 RepID=UPI003919EFEE|nr:hypothetical protein [Novosphingobium sp.]MCE2842437.1 hypothetical protein [Novosphingobium sp.]